MNYKVSVVVPVYNVEEYLHSCIESLFGQSYKNIEIILVDDESPDNCPRLCDEYAVAHENIKVLHKKNGGLGYARNSGLEIATGDFVEFLDSDDYIENDTIERALHKIVNDNADVCCFSCKKLDVNGNITVESVSFPPMLRGEKVKDILFPIYFGGSQRNGGKEKYRLGSSCMAIYRRSFLIDNNIRFESERDVLSEDVLFNISVCQKASCITFLNENFYVYRENLSSLTHSYRPDRFDKACNLFEREKQIIADQGERNVEALHRAQDSLISNLIVSIKQCVGFANMSRKEKLKEIRRMSKGELARNLQDYPFDELPLMKRIYIRQVLKGRTTLVYFMTKMKC
ncbi:glycosyltransferase family 2 protein [Anaerolactibacter massiliensis]|uniref:glycosyltransferase family 2 protein n=1 Tax=Anaerolactibacter massiliensis TaxID=2044573 RepID=UPI000CF84391|nr:glycosyltransferase family 2 protein [Anaerolactibacter massiliensis]